MSETKANRRLDPYLWGTIFAVLSLDVASPFVPNMGLQLPPGDSFRTGLRKIIEEFRRLEAKQTNIAEPFVEAVFNWTAQRYGQELSDQLYAWGENVFQSGSGKGATVFLWNNIVRRGGLKGERDHRLPPHFVTTLRALLAPRAKPLVNRLRPVSTWDKEVYDRQQYDEFRNAMELVQATINYNDFISAWREALAVSDKVVDMEEINRWAMGEASILGMPVDRVGHPRDWGGDPSQRT
jgi:hypothetical protein